MRRALVRPGLTVALLAGLFLASLAIYPFLGLAFFPRTDAGQFTINLKAPTGTRIEVTEQYVAKVENLIRQTVDPKDFKLVVSNIGVVPDFSSLYTTNAGEYTATVQVQLQDDHRRSSFDYMQQVQDELSKQDPEIRTFFSSGSMVDAILNMGMPAPIDVQVSSSNLEQSYGIAEDLARQIRELPGVGQVYIPQDMNYPALRLDVDRVHAGELGLSQKDVVDNVITALNSNLMIAPNYWVDRKTGNDYFLTVQYFENGSPAIHNSMDLKNIPLRAPNLKEPTTLDTVVKLTSIQTPTEVDHYQIQRVSDVYVTPKGEDLGKLTTAIRGILAQDQYSGQCAGQFARHGEWHGSVLQELRAGLPALFYAAVSHPGGAVSFLRRSLPDHAGHSHGVYRGAHHPAAHSQHHERDVAHGSADAGGHRRFQQHPDCGFRA